MTENNTQHEPPTAKTIKKQPSHTTDRIKQYERNDQMYKHKRPIAITTILLILLTCQIASKVNSHCQIPCGIYDDQARLDAIAEHITTIEKSIKQITELSQAKSPDYNQIVRWTNNKDHHADKLANIVTYYFMAQRVKPTVADSGQEKKYMRYLQQISLLREMLVTSMKCKQTTNLKHTEELKSLLEKFKHVYPD